jgi:hypothetical protein
MRRRPAPIVRPPAITAADIQAQWRAKAEALPKETRQMFMNGIHQGLTIGQARDMVGIDLDTAMGIMEMNIESLLVLKRVSP